MHILDIKYKQFTQEASGRYDLLLPDGTFIICNELECGNVFFTIQLSDCDEIMQHILPIEQFVVGINEYIDANN